jgi:saccharopine dehydrogenase (NAD+, L-lysine forming)
MTDLIWLRTETKAMEARSALTPSLVQALIKNNFEVVVERSSQRAIDDASFAETGCRMVESGSWTTAPKHAYILGLKELPDDTSQLSHRHIYFAHAYKNQHGWKTLLDRFARGGGKLFDLEYLIDDSRRRVAAFGYWAGYAGCAVGLKIWANQQLKQGHAISALKPYRDQTAMLDELRHEVATAIEVSGYKPSIIIIGALGRVGEGATKLASALALPVIKWDMEETASGGPFPQILEHDIFINCVLVQKKIPPFLTSDTVNNENRRLSVICDVSCDPSEYNPIPLYSEATTFSAPVHNITAGGKSLQLSAIDHLPSLLPVEASEDFGLQLLPHLLELKDEKNAVWQRALSLFNEKSKDL